MRGAESDNTDRVLADELRANQLPQDMCLEVIAILGERGSGHGTAVLEDLASRRFAMRARTRAQRRAARVALRGGTA